MELNKQAYRQIYLAYLFHLPVTVTNILIKFTQKNQISHLALFGFTCTVCFKLCYNDLFVKDELMASWTFFYLTHNIRWATHWFKVEIEIPGDWVGKEVQFLWDSQSEAMIWRNGKPIQVSGSILIIVLRRTLSLACRTRIQPCGQLRLIRHPKNSDFLYELTKVPN